VEAHVQHAVPPGHEVQSALPWGLKLYPLAGGRSRQPLRRLVLVQITGLRPSGPNGPVELSGAGGCHQSCSERGIEPGSFPKRSTVEQDWSEEDGS
jgi:hypothetical protein